MQFKVPQNIDMEDKIIGPLTMKQFFYLLAGGVIDYFLFTKLVPVGLTFLFVVIGMPIGILALALAFVRVQNRPFADFLVAYFVYLSKPRARVWRHIERQKVVPKPVDTEKEITARVVHKDLDISKVEEVAGILDKGGKGDETKN